MRKIKFEIEAFNQYNNWANENIRIFKKTAKLITEIQKEPFTGTGKPEPLKHELSGYWSRRITDEHRLIYKVNAEEIIIVSCKFHY